MGSIEIPLTKRTPEERAKYLEEKLMLCMAKSMERKQAILLVQEELNRMTDVIMKILNDEFGLTVATWKKIDKALEDESMTKFLSEDEKKKEILTPPMQAHDPKLDLLHALDRITKLETALHQVEWVGVPPICPWCHGFKHYGGHYSGCMRQLVLED